MSLYDEFEKRFGTRHPSIPDICRLCGRDYGAHFGHRCPPKPDDSDPFAIFDAAPATVQR